MTFVIHPLIHDWNLETASPRGLAMLDDETLRDGLQSPSVRTPTIDEKIDILRRMDALGIETANIGLPAAGPHIAADVERLARAIPELGLAIKANCAARTVLADIEPIARIAQRTGVPIECCAFIGSSPIRQYAEGWTIEQMVENTRNAVRFPAGTASGPLRHRRHDQGPARNASPAVRDGDRRGRGAGRGRDTVGHSTPDGVRAVVGYVRRLLDEMKPDTGLDWHGHSDRGLGVINAIDAALAGADRIHGCALGLGERVGNTHLDLLLVNFRLLGWIDTDLTRLREMGEVIAEGTGMAIPANYPVLGRDAFRTATGVHAAAVMKAFRKQDRPLMDAVYAAVPASLVGREQEIEVGPMSGRSNVIFWLERRGLPATEAIVDRIFTAAKASSRVLSHDQIDRILGDSH